MAEINDLTIADSSNTARFPENMAPSAVNDGARALEGLLARWHRDINCSVTTAGTSTAYTYAANQTLTAYYDGMLLGVDFHTACGDSPTINVDSIGAKSLVHIDGTALVTGDIATDQKGLIVYDGTNFILLTQSNSGILVSEDAGATAGPTLDLYRNSASPAADDDLGAITFSGEDDGGNKTVYAEIRADIVDETDTTEDGALRFRNIRDSTEGDKMELRGGLMLPDATITGADKGVGTINLSGGYYVDGELIGPNLQTEQATTSGTSVDFTSLPPGIKRVTIMFEGVSTSGTSIPIIQLGDSGGFETTGYTGSSDRTATSAAVNLSSGFNLGPAWAAATTLDGTMTITLKDSTNNTWNAVFVGGLTNSANVYITSGVKSLSAVLTQIRLTTVGGSDTFDAGSYNIAYEVF